MKMKMVVKLTHNPNDRLFFHSLCLQRVDLLYPLLIKAPVLARTIAQDENTLECPYRQKEARERPTV